MTRHLTKLSLFAASLLVGAATAVPAMAEPKVVASIQPIHSLVAAVMEGVGKPALLVRGEASPHTYALKPSQARQLSQADAIFWVHEEIESFLEKPLESLGKKSALVELGEVPGIKLFEYREGGAWEEDDHSDHAKHDDHDHDKEHAKHDDHKDHDHGKEHAKHDDHDHDKDHAKHDDHKDHDHDKEHAKHDDHDHDKDHAKHDDHKDHDHGKEHAKHDDHDHGKEHAKHDGHEGHHHGEHDMHIWLDPQNARHMVAAIAGKLKSVDPANAATYDANAKKVTARLTNLEANIAASLKPVNKVPFFVFHDAYQYFEKRFGLNGAGSITVNPDRKPGAKRVAELREKIEHAKVACVFAEPQFEPAIVKSLVDGTKAKSGVLDPLGSDIAPGPDGYFKLLEKMAKSLAGCLSPST